MDYLPMICSALSRFLSLRFLLSFFVLWALFPMAHAATSIVYPRFSAFDFSPFTSSTSPTFGGTFKIPAGDAAFVHNFGVKMGHVYQSPSAGSLAATSRMSAADALAMNSAITGASKVSQSAAKSLAAGIIRLSVGGVLATVALDMGFEFLQGRWTKSPPLGTTFGCNPIDFGGASAVCLNVLGSTYACVGNSVRYNPATPNYDARPYCIPSMSAASRLDSFIPSIKVPVTDLDWSTAPSQMTRDLSDAELDWMVRNGYAVPVEKPAAMVIGDFSAMTAVDLAALTARGYFQKNPVTVNAGAPFKDPITGEIKQPQITAEPAPNGGVKITATDKPVNPDGTPATNPDDTPKPVEDSKDPCAANPDSVACVSLGTLDGADPVPTTFNVSLTSGTLSTAGSCPAPRALNLAGHPVVMSFQPICDASSTYVRPFVLLASAVVSAFIFMGGLKSS